MGRGVDNTTNTASAITAGLRRRGRGWENSRPIPWETRLTSARKHLTPMLELIEDVAAGQYADEDSSELSIIAFNHMEQNCYRTQLMETVVKLKSKGHSTELFHKLISPISKHNNEVNILNDIWKFTHENIPALEGFFIRHKDNKEILEDEYVKNILKGLTQHYIKNNFKAPLKLKDLLERLGESDCTAKITHQIKKHMLTEDNFQHGLRFLEQGPPSFNQEIMNAIIEGIMSGKNIGHAPSYVQKLKQNPNSTLFKNAFIQRYDNLIDADTLTAELSKLHPQQAVNKTQWNQVIEEHKKNTWEGAIWWDRDFYKDLAEMVVNQENNLTDEIIAEYLDKKYQTKIKKQNKKTQRHIYQHMRDEYRRTVVQAIVYRIDRSNPVDFEQAFKRSLRNSYPIDNDFRL